MTLSSRTLFVIWLLLSFGTTGVLILGHANGNGLPQQFHSTVRSWSETAAYVLAPLAGEPVEAKAMGLYIDTHPTSARVQIMNIKPVYEPGMVLPSGRYDVVVSAPGYIPERRWVELSPSDSRFVFTLNRQ